MKAPSRPRGFLPFPIPLPEERLPLPLPRPLPPRPLPKNVSSEASSVRLATYAVIPFPERLLLPFLSCLPCVFPGFQKNRRTLLTGLRTHLRHLLLLF